MATLRLGDTVPDFTQDSTAEFGKTTALGSEFVKRNVKPIAPQPNR